MSLYNYLIILTSLVNHLFFFFFFLENRDFYINCVDKEDWFWYFQFGWLKLLTDTTDCKSNKINVTKVDIGNYL